MTDPLADLAQAVRPDIINLIDNALADNLSADAMRWTPDPPPEPVTVHGTAVIHVGPDGLWQLGPIGWTVP
jgi:hypothetical protein